MTEIKNICRVHYRLSLFSAVDYFLSCREAARADIHYYIQCPENAEGKLSEFYTLLVDLNKSEAELWNNIYHRTQAEIKSFLTNSSYSYELNLNPDPGTLRHFMALYDEFAAIKKIRKAEKRRLQAYRAAGILGISWIRSGAAYLCVNFYRVNTLRAANLHSFTLRHANAEGHSASFYGKAHRSLHWLDMLEFKKRGLPLYDFCGWYEGKENKELLNINAFKEQFGGYQVKEYTGVIYRNMLFRLLKKFI